MARDPVMTDRGLMRRTLRAAGRDGPMVAGIDRAIMGERLPEVALNL